MPRWQIVDVDKIPRKFRNPFIVRLTEKDAKKLLKGARQVPKFPPGSGGLLLIPNPDGDYDIMPSCPEANPDVVCVVKMAPWEGRAGVTWRCVCRPVGKKRDPVPPLKECVMSLDARTMSLKCASVGCSKCVLEVVASQVGSHTIRLFRCRCAG